MRRSIVATLTVFCLLAIAAAPIARITVERTDGSKQEFTPQQLAQAVAEISAPTTEPAQPVGTVSAVTLRNTATKAVIGTFNATGDLSAAIPPGGSVYVQADTTGPADSVEFRFGDGVGYVEHTAPWTYGLQFNPLGWKPAPGLYTFTITPFKGTQPGTPTAVRLTVPGALVQPAQPPVIQPPVTTSSGYVRTDVGFTPFPLAPGAKEYFCSDRGNDANPGTLTAPLRTLQKATALCRNGSGDRVRPLAGSTFYGETFWAVSGKDDFYSGIIAYGEGARPRIETPTNGIRCGKSIYNVAFSGLFITSTVRNPNLPKTFQKNPQEWDGIDLRNPESGNLLIEDCQIEWFGNDIVAHSTTAGKVHDGVRVNRCIITDAWAPRIFGGQGFYSESLRRLILTENFYDSNGRISAAALGMVLVDTQYRHDNYHNHTTVDMVSKGNWFWRAASFGIQNRGGGTHDGDWIWDCGNGANGFGATAIYKNCLIMGGHPRAATDTEVPTGGASGISLGASNSRVENCYFWGRPVAQMGTMKYPAEAVQIVRDKSYTPAGPINWTVAGNGFVFWPATPSAPNADNYLTISGVLTPVDWSKNFRAKAPPSANVWPDQALINYLRNRPMRHWVTRGTPAQAYAEFQRANGR